MRSKSSVDCYWCAVLLLLFVSRIPSQDLHPKQGNECAGQAVPNAEIAPPSEKTDALLRAADLYQQSLRCFPDPDTNRATILLKLGKAQLRLGKPELALPALSEAIEIFDKASPGLGSLTFEEASAYLDRGTAFSSLGRSQEAILAYKQALHQAEKAHDHGTEVLALAELGRIYYLMGENQSALGFYSQALRHQPDEKERTFLLDLTGRAYARMNESGLAMHYYLSALALARKTRYYRFIAYTSNDIGSLLLEDHRSKDAMNYHAAALRTLEEHEASNLDGIAETLTLLADATSLAVGSTGN